MVRRNVAFAGAGILVFAILIFVIWPPPRKPQVDFELGDGTSLSLVEVAHGKMLRFYDGSDWQKALYSISGDYLPDAFRGTEIYMASVDTNGTLALKFKYSSRKGDLPHPDWFPIIVQIPPTASKPAAIQPSGEFKLQIGTNTKANLEYIVFEFPLSHELEIHFRCYQPNEQGRVLSTNDFIIANPAFK